MGEEDLRRLICDVQRVVVGIERVLLRWSGRRLWVQQKAVMNC